MRWHEFPCQVFFPLHTFDLPTMLHCIPLPIDSLENRQINIMLSFLLSTLDDNFHTTVSGVAVRSINQFLIKISFSIATRSTIVPAATGKRNESEKRFQTAFVSNYRQFPLIKINSSNKKKSVELAPKLSSSSQLHIMAANTLCIINMNISIISSSCWTMWTHSLMLFCFFLPFFLLWSCLNRRKRVLMYFHKGGSTVESSWVTNQRWKRPRCSKVTLYKWLSIPRNWHWRASQWNWSWLNTIGKKWMQNVNCLILRDIRWGIERRNEVKCNSQKFEFIGGERETQRTEGTEAAWGGLSENLSVIYKSYCGFEIQINLLCERTNWVE